ncbi:glucan biosynthesis protein, partial [Escherichia coli]
VESRGLGDVYKRQYWNNLKTPFKLEFYHQGMYFDTPVKINEVTATAVKRIKYSPDYFTFGDVQHDKDTVKDLGFAGFKVLYPVSYTHLRAHETR